MADETLPEQLSSEPVELVISAEDVGRRLDIFLAHQFPHYSRVHLKKMIHAGGAKVNGQPVRAAFKLRLGQQVSVVLPELPVKGPQPENIPLEILFEDEQLAAINKPANMVVHPGRGHWQGTLTAALAFHFGQLSTIGGAARPGIVHRLDRETSGVIVIAKTNRAHFELASQFEERSLEKEYFALVIGELNRDRDEIDAPIGIHPYQREKMAQTFYEVVERFKGYAAVKLLPHTGRTHQLRVHLAHIGNPVLCDRQYGGRNQITRGEIRGEPADTTVLLERHALHARRLQITHPVTRERLEFVAPLPPDMTAILDELRVHRPVTPGTRRPATRR